MLAQPQEKSADDEKSHHKNHADYVEHVRNRKIFIVCSHEKLQEHVRNACRSAMLISAPSSHICGGEKSPEQPKAREGPRGRLRTAATLESFSHRPCIRRRSPFQTGQPWAQAVVLRPYLALASDCDAASYSSQSSGTPSCFYVLTY